MLSSFPSLTSLPGTFVENFYYVSLVSLTFSLPYLLILKRNDKLKKCLDTNRKHMFPIHGILTPLILFLLQPDVLIPFQERYFWVFGGASAAEQATIVIRYCLQTFLAWVLWDLGNETFQPGSWNNITVQFHHLALFLPLYFGEYETRGETGRFNASDEGARGRNWRNTTLNGHLWFCHAFGFLVDHIFPLLCIKRKENERLWQFTLYKHVYALGNVFLIHLYFRAPHQPGVGYDNYQTWTLLFFLTGRFLTNDNYRHVDFIRRIELPGVVVVLIDAVFFGDVFLHRALAVLMGFVCFVLAPYVLWFLEVEEIPDEYIGPAGNAELREFLETCEGSTDSANFCPSNPDESPEKILEWLKQFGGSGESEAVVKGEETGKDGAAGEETDPVSAKDVAAGEETELKGAGESGVTEHASSSQTTVPSQQFVTDNKYQLNRLIVLNDVAGVKDYLDSHPGAHSSPFHGDHSGSLPLQWSNFLARTEITLILLKRGANPYELDAANNSAWGERVTETVKRHRAEAPHMRPDASEKTVGSVAFWRKFNEICLRKEGKDCPQDKEGRTSSAAGGELRKRVRACARML